ncbi:hypothetical protein CEV34_3665 [Brucella pseudogrignonensis]|jgi:hypothetical protein|uniref:Uncharacterized protein n=1 Tax=Brucella pseudogrignonensis TaxID=419475 RepID=A0A256GAI9_9HYPH|nr:hypothetical protein CEV34_3665 [Brucella pseudogrignonensis]
MKMGSECEPQSNRGWRSSVAQNEMDHQKEDDEPDESGGENN